MSNENLVWRWVGDDTLVLLDLETGQYHSLNWTAGIVWLTLHQGGTVEQAIDRLQEFTNDVERDQLYKDAREIAERLEQMSLLIQGEAAVDNSDTIEEDEGFPIPVESGLNYIKPSVRKHEALQQVTAGTYYSGSSYSYSYYYYYYYYY